MKRWGSYFSARKETSSEVTNMSWYLLHSKRKSLIIAAYLKIFLLFDRKDTWKQETTALGLHAIMCLMKTIGSPSSSCEMIIMRKYVKFSIKAPAFLMYVENPGGLSSSCEMIILRHNSYGGIMRVCMGIFTTALRNKKKSNSQLKILHLTSTEYRLLSDRLLRWRKPSLASYPFRGFLRT